MRTQAAHRTRSASETEQLGATIAKRLAPGDVVLVSGDLGAGKTTLIRGASRALGVTDRVTSPSFVIGQRYRGRVAVSHLDLYRLDDLELEDPALLEDYLDAETVSFIEWPEQAELRLPRVTLRVRIDHSGGDERLIELS